MELPHPGINKAR